MPTIHPKKNVSHSICLNLCSNCNLNCSWCYKQTLQEPLLNFDDFEMFYERIIRRNIDTVTLIGGEPTIHPDFFRILERLKNKNVFLNTNGLMFSDWEFLRTCIESVKNSGQMFCRTSGLKSISVSLKGYDEESFMRTTQTCDFVYLCRAISNLNACAIPVAYSYTYAEDMTAHQMESFVSFLLRYRIYNLVLNDVRPYYQMDNTVAYPVMTEKLETFAHRLENAGITVYFRLNRPLCEYSSTLIDYIIKNQRLISKCAVKIGRGYFFSALLELIPCNELYSVILGKFGSDFNNFAELEKLWNMHYIRNFYQELSGYPDIKCKQCSLWRICGGSCILNWLK